VRVEPVVVQTIRTEDIGPDLRASVIRVCIAAHDNQDFENLFSYIPSGGRHFLAYSDDEVVAHAVVTTRWVQPDGQPELRTAYVDAVSTLPSCQGRGFGSAVMRRLGEQIDDYAIGCLQTERTTFYQRVGWELWRGPLAGRGEHDLIPTPDQKGVMVFRLPHTPPVDVDGSMTIECQASRIW